MGGAAAAAGGVIAVLTKRTVLLSVPAGEDQTEQAVVSL